MGKTIEEFYAETKPLAEEVTRAQINLLEAEKKETDPARARALFALNLLLMNIDDLPVPTEVRAILRTALMVAERLIT